MLMELFLEGSYFTSQELTLMVTLFIISAAAAIFLNKFAHLLAAKKFGGESFGKDAAKRKFPIFNFSDLLSIFVLLVFGFAPVKKPVPRALRKQNMLIALSGPITNIIAGFAGLILYQIFFAIAEATFKMGQESPIETVLSLFYTFASVNAAVAIFNLIPIPPLDGGVFIAQLLPEDKKNFFLKFEKYSFFVLVFLVIFLSRSGLYLQLIGGFVMGLLSLIMPLFSAFGK